MSDSSEPRLPVHETTYRELRDLILFGGLAPGQKVTIQGLVADLGAGMTPVREAIRRLTAEGALELHDNRRVSVPKLTLPQLEELAFARLAIEPELASRALLRIDADAVEALAARDREIDAAIEAQDIAGYLRGNYRFHFELYDHAAAPILTGMAHSLWLRSGPSLRVMVDAGPAIGPDRHREALAALRSGDAKALAAAVAEDITQGLTRVRDELAGLAE